MSKRTASLSPPNPPWRDIPFQAASGGYVAYYYSDDLSPLPVRAVTKVRDNKTDPNIETLSYGLFSRCDRPARGGIVKRGCRYLFFVTRRGRPRVLTGMYLVRWYATLSKAAKDFCLAADEAWFVGDPIPLSDVDRACGTRIDRWFRNCLCLDSREECRRLEALLRTRTNALGAYLEETDRLERFNLKHGGYRYVSGKVRQAFSWQCQKAKTILEKAAADSRSLAGRENANR